MKFDWKETGNAWYFFRVRDGRVIGQTHEISHTKIWVSKVIHNHNEEKYLGQYITLEFAKKAIEAYWIQQEVTLLEADF